MKKTKKQLEEEILDLKKLIVDSEKIGLLGNNSGNNISNCTFTGVQWDAKAIESVHTVARGLLNLTELFKSQNIKIESMIKMEGLK